MWNVWILCAPSTITIVIARARVVWWRMKITPDKDLNYGKKNLHFNLSTIPIGVADFVSVVKELLAGTFLRRNCIGAETCGDGIGGRREKESHVDYS